MTETADVVIIGGGVHGCSLAFHLSALGAGRVVLIEKKHIAAGPTAQSGAMIRALFDDRIYVDLVWASTHMFENWSELVGGNAGFVQEGFLRIANSLDVADLGGDLELSKAAGELYEILSRDEVSRLVPAGEFRDGEFGILFPKGGYADPYKAAVELADAARRHGAEACSAGPIRCVPSGRSCRTGSTRSTSGRWATPAQMILGRPVDIDLSFFRWPRGPEVQARTSADWVHE